MAERWHVKGEYFENCNCEVLCPCYPTHLQGEPTEGHCDGPLLFHINEGQYGEVELAGLNVVNILSTPGPIAEGNATAALYIDERADESQREALGAIFGGQAGGPLAALGPLITSFLGVKYVPIEYVAQGNSRSGGIPDILDLRIEAITGANPDDPIWLENAPHPVSTRISMARSTTATYTDYGLNWDNTGRNGHYSAFEWSGP
jgi:hypothetical protein